MKGATGSHRNGAAKGRHRERAERSQRGEACAFADSRRGGRLGNGGGARQTSLSYARGRTRLWAHGHAGSEAEARMRVCPQASRSADGHGHRQDKHRTGPRASQVLKTRPCTEAARGEKSREQPEGGLQETSPEIEAMAKTTDTRVWEAAFELKKALERSVMVILVKMWEPRTSATRHALYSVC